MADKRIQEHGNKRKIKVGTQKQAELCSRIFWGNREH